MLLGINFINKMTQRANAQVGIFWHLSVSPTKLHLTLSVHSTGIYAQLYARKISENLLPVKLQVEH